MKTTILAASLMAALLSGCATQTTAPYRAEVYRSGEARREMSVRHGTITDVRAITLQEDNSGVGTLAGAALGGLAGNGIGKGSGRKAATLLGAIAGGVAGSRIEGDAHQSQGVEYTVVLDSGHEIVVVQPATQILAAGTRVRIVGSGSNTRVAP